MSSTGGQRSDARDLQASISALIMADNGVSRIRADVEATKHDLGSRYAGADGAAFGKLVDGWLTQSDRILAALRRLQHQMETVLQTKQQEQGANIDAINQRAAQGEQAFQTLTARG